MYRKIDRATRQLLILVITVVSGILLTAFAPFVWAQEKTEEQSGWEYSVDAYVWALSLNGDVTVRGSKSHVDMDFSDIWDDLNIAAMFAFSGRKGRWGYHIDTMYSHLGSPIHANGVRIDPELNALWLTAYGFYRLGTWGLFDTPSKNMPTVTVDALAGARYTYLDLSLSIKGNRSRKADGHQDWLDPLIGVRTLWGLSERWTLALVGTVGGFGTGSDFTWYSRGLLGYRFSWCGKNNAHVFGGYRGMYQDYQDGHGSNKFEWDVTLHGPIMGLNISF